MKYNTKKNVHQVLTAITIKRLNAYAKLCELYSKLAEIMINDEGRAQVTPADIEQRYSAILSSVTYNDLDEESYERIAEESTFSPKEVEIFKKFSEVSKDFIDFTNGYNILKDSISKDSDEVDQEVVDDYLNFMNTKTSNERTRNFTEYIHVHSPTIIGKNYFSQYQRALKKIDAIDPTHLNLPQFNSTNQISREMFGSTTLRFSPETSRQFRLRRQREQVDIDASVIDDSKDIDNVYSRISYSRPITPEEKISEYLYSGKVIAADAIKETKLPVKVLAVALSAMILTGGVLSAVIKKSRPQIPATDAYQNGLGLDISNSTAEELLEIKNELDRLSNSPTLPSPDELSTITQRLDVANSDVAQDLTAAGFQKAHPDYHVNKVDTSYKDSSSDGRYIDIVIHYTDENGNSQSLKVKNIDNDFIQSFNREDSYSTVLPEKLKKIADDNLSFNKRSKLIQEYLEDCGILFENLDKFGGMEANYRGDKFPLGSKISADKVTEEAAQENSSDFTSNGNPSSHDDGPEQ